MLNPCEEAFSCMKTYVKHLISVQYENIVACNNLPWGQRMQGRMDILHTKSCAAVFIPAYSSQKFRTVQTLHDALYIVHCTAAFAVVFLYTIVSCFWIRVIFRFSPMVFSDIFDVFFPWFVWFLCLPDYTAIMNSGDLGKNYDVQFWTYVMQFWTYLVHFWTLVMQFWTFVMQFWTFIMHFWTCVMQFCTYLMHVWTINAVI